MFKPLRCVVAALACASALSAGAQTAPNAGAELRAQRVAASLAQELAAQCPLAAPGSQAAFDACRQALFQPGSQLRQNLPEFVLWGRQRDPKLSLKETNLTQFGPDVLSGMYLSLFMFNGQHTVTHVESEGLYQIRLKTAFRNRLSPGQFPYPFWHEEEKWSMYQQANEILLWWDPKNDRIKVAQFTVHGPTPPLLAVEMLKPHSFSGEWLWTDAQGKTQPKVTVFDGLFKPDNPYLNQLDGAYKNLALRLREGQCDECHVPNNPDKMKRLVLLQTPAHAGAEIKRLIKSVQDDKMPRDEAGIEQPLPQHTKAALLRDSKTFDKLYDAAKQWEAGHGERTPMMAGKRGEAGGR
ncbi:MAG: hypothetical protein IV105_00495 [Rhizobacter sp.]|nr:hypothetical protein [Rhizobacter sp.]